MTHPNDDIPGLTAHFNAPPPPSLFSFSLLTVSVSSRGKSGLTGGRDVSRWLSRPVAWAPASCPSCPQARWFETRLGESGRSARRRGSADGRGLAWSGRGLVWYGGPHADRWTAYTDPSRMMRHRSVGAMYVRIDSLCESSMILRLSHAPTEHKQLCYKVQQKHLSRVLSFFVAEQFIRYVTQYFYGSSARLCMQCTLVTQQISAQNICILLHCTT